MLSLIITFLLILGITIFALQNGKVTDVKFLLWEYNSSLVIVILGSTLVGAAIMAVMTWPKIIKKHLNERRLTKNVRELEKKTQELERQLKEREGRDINFQEEQLKE